MPAPSVRIPDPWTESGMASCAGPVVDVHPYRTRKQALIPALEDYLKAGGRGSVGRLADAIGIRIQYLSKIRHGWQLASLQQAVAIERATGGAVRVSDLAPPPAPGHIQAV